MSLVQLHPRPGAGAVAPSLAPRFVLAIGSSLFLQNERYDVVARLPDGRWHLQSDENATRFLTDERLAEYMRNGEFHLDRERRSRAYAPPPLSPLVVGPEGHAANQRKHEYVLACLNAPGGFTRSRPKLLPIIQSIAAVRGEKAPGFTTVLSWIIEWETHGGSIGTAAYSNRHDLKGRRRDILQPWQENAIEAGLEAFFQLGTRAKAYIVVCNEVAKFDRVHGQRIDKGSLGPLFVDEHGRLRAPSLRTFERRCSEINRFELDWGLKGPAYAKQRNRTYQTTRLPDRPYAEVEVDHTRLDVLVLDDERGFVLGRPNITVLRDRATAMILGYGLGFEDPSYASFIQALRHATYPKGPPLSSRAVNDWPCYGRPENLVVDNGLEFIGRSIDAAGRELGFNTIRLKPRQPWLKGAVERFFGTAGVGLLHSLPGTTLSNVLERRNHEHLGEATLTLSELDVLLDWWIRDYYHADSTKGLGFIRGFGGVPLDVWREKVRHLRTAPLPDPELFLSLVGEVDHRTIQTNGITWDHLIYEGPPLWNLRSHARHRRSGEGSASTKYEVVRDPFDLSSIRVIDPYNREPVTVAITAAHAEYAKGLSLHQHQVIVANAKRLQRDDKITIDSLLDSKAELARLVASMRRNPGRIRVQRSVGRYLHVEQSKRHRSQISLDPPAQSPPGFIRFDQAPSGASATASGEFRRQHEPRPWDGPDDDDLNDLRRDKNWSAYSE